VVRGGLVGKPTGLEGRVEVDEGNRLVAEVSSEDVEVVAVVELVVGHVPSCV